MRKITLTFLAVLAIVASVAPGQTYADEDLSLVINPRTGAASIRNDTGATIDINGYLITANQPALNPAGWVSLQDAGLSNWREANPANNHLGELNLVSSLALGGGASQSIGAPYIGLIPTAIGQVGPPVTFEYSVGTMGSFLGDVVFAPQNNVVLRIDPVTGNAALENQSNFGVNIDALLITSPTNALDPVGWNGLAESGVAGWTSGAAETNRLAEGNLTGSTFLAANGGTVSIGAPINPSVINDETDVVLQYHIAGGSSVTGGVVFASLEIGLTGDYNGDGKVDAADYVVWRKNNINGQQGYTDWRANFGAMAASGSGSGSALHGVPEPAAFLLLAFLAPLMVLPRLGGIPVWRRTN